MAGDPDEDSLYHLTLAGKLILQADGPNSADERDDEGEAAVGAGRPRAAGAPKSVPN